VGAWAFTSVASAATDEAGATSDGNIIPELVAGNPTCEDLGYAYGYKPQNPNGGGDWTTGSGSWGPDADTGGYTFGLSGDGTYVDWTSTPDFTGAVVVKGSNAADSYVYEVAVGGDTGLTAPVNSSGDFAGISHVQFCWDDNPPPSADPLTVEKTATPSFDKKYVWTIDKKVDKTTVKQIGGSATFNYTVSVGHDGGTDGNWKVDGKITVANPNADDVTGVDVTDAIDNGGTCVVTDGTDVTVPGSGNKVLDYSCDYAAEPSPAAGTNTATVAWEDQTLSGGGFLAKGSDTGTASFDFGAATPNLIDDSVTVTDNFAGTLSTLGTASVVGDNPTEFKYSRTIAVQAGCQSYDNTATFTTNDTGATGNASQTVQVCGPAATGALTIGFWKTTNGQNLVNTYCQNGSSNLGTYLGSLGAGSGPFAGAPTSCPLLKTYVFNILNGATATDMNKMLKAQMLATALDVWFSGPGWTSTTVSKVKPPSTFLSHNSLGTFNMDTTAICPMVDNSSTGTATCKNNTPSTNAFASYALPAASMTMQAILDYAANPAFSGTTWYAGNRTKQEILKNVFDQFNNRFAFGSF
ncbi:MAG TPA: hypothetical protein VK279_10045, partial [Solirubrobacteraceae bacterium]|nr:hypothetical protein [Solirubrobacteraceae bacterium]